MYTVSLPKVELIVGVMILTGLSGISAAGRVTQQTDRTNASSRAPDDQNYATATRLPTKKNEAVHIVYVFDISDAKPDGDRVEKGKAAAKKALGELTKADSFDIVGFNKEVRILAPQMLAGTADNVARGLSFIDSLHAGNGSNLSGAMTAALSLDGANQIYVMSVGAPDTGIRDFKELREYVKARNVRHVRINTLVTATGGNFPGIILLKGIADDSGGTYGYVDLRRIPSPSK